MFLKFALIAWLVRLALRPSPAKRALVSNLKFKYFKIFKNVLKIQTSLIRPKYDPRDLQKRHWNVQNIMWIIFYKQTKSIWLSEKGQKDILPNSLTISKANPWMVLPAGMSSNLRVPSTSAFTLSQILEPARQLRNIEVPLRMDAVYNQNSWAS